MNSALHAEIKDEQGNVVHTSLLDLSLSHLALNLSGVGFYSVDITAEQENSQPKLIGKTNIAVIPPIATDANNNFGLWHVHGDPVLSAMAGSRWTRLLRTVRAYKLDAQGEIVPIPTETKTDLPLFAGSKLIDTLSYALPEFLRSPSQKPYPKLYPPCIFPSVLVSYHHARRRKLEPTLKA